MVAIIDGTFSGHPFTLRLTITAAAPNIPANTTYISWSLEMIKTGNYSPYRTDGSPWQVLIDGTPWSGTLGPYSFASVGVGGSILIATGSKTVNHNSDGTKSFLAGANINAASTIGYAAANGTVFLDTIPRASYITYAPNPPLVAGTDVTIYTNRASSSFTHTITYTFEGTSGTVATGVGASYTWTVPLTLLNQIPNTLTGNGTFTTKTYSGSTLIGTTARAFSVTTPTSAVPTVTGVTATEATAGVATAVGAFVQNVSTLALTATAAAGVYGSTITSTKITVSGQTINAASGTTPTPITASGTVPITVTVTDSRGRTGSATSNITVLAYTPPTITAASAVRSDAAGTPVNEGTYFRVNINAAVSSLINGSQKNTLTYRISTRLHSGGTWVVKNTTTPSGITFNSFKAVGPGYDIEESYDVLVEVIDKFATTALLLTVATAAIFMHWDGGDGIGFGKFREHGRLDVHGDIYSDGTVYTPNVSATDVASTTVHTTDVESTTAGGNVSIQTGGTGKVVIGPASDDKDIELHGRMVNPYLPWAMAAGSINATMSGASVTGITVTLPASRFTVAPMVTVNLSSGAGGTQKDVVRCYTQTTTSLTFGAWTGDQTASASHTTNFMWIAVQMTSGSAVG